MPSQSSNIKGRKQQIAGTSVLKKRPRGERLRFAMALTLSLQTTPNAPRSEIVGWLGDRLKVKVKAPAVEGKANAELLRFLAERFGVRPNAVTLVRGDTARLKTVRIEGVEAADLARVCPGAP